MNKNSKGFTLVELFLIVIIIGILSTLIISLFQHVTDRTIFAVAKSNLATLQRAVWLYYTTNGEYPQTLYQLVTSGYIN